MKISDILVQTILKLAVRNSTHVLLSITSLTSQRRINCSWHRKYKPRTLIFEKNGLKFFQIIIHFPPSHPLQKKPLLTVSADTYTNC